MAGAFFLRNFYPGLIFRLTGLSFAFLKPKVMLHCRLERPASALRSAMDLKLFASTFIAIFLAELGDKTQLATFSLAASSEKRWAIFLGASLALIASTLIGVTVGGFVMNIVPPEYIRMGAGLLFILLGIAMIMGKL
jgi:putative Ca2+/H+ antiporter (TMEM165/GDT1 family)